jgi:predicted DNA binding CopG/RHH family protein
MRTEYNFTKAVKNPYVKKEKKAITIRLENDVVDYFKGMSSETGIPYQNLINLYLRDCAEHSRKLSLLWHEKNSKA